MPRALFGTGERAEGVQAGNHAVHATRWQTEALGVHACRCVHQELHAYCSCCSYYQPDTSCWALAVLGPPLAPPPMLGGLPCPPHSAPLPPPRSLPSPPAPPPRFLRHRALSMFSATLGLSFRLRQSCLVLCRSASATFCSSVCTRETAGAGLDGVGWGGGGGSDAGPRSAQGGRGVHVQAVAVLEAFPAVCSTGVCSAMPVQYQAESIHGRQHLHCCSHACIRACMPCMCARPPRPPRNARLMHQGTASGPPASYSP